MDEKRADERLFDVWIAEAAGRGPRADLEARVFAAPTPGRQGHFPWLRAALVLLAVAVVVSVPFWQGQRDTVATQDPSPKEIAAWVHRLGVDEAADDALLALGTRAVPALAAALQDEQAPRAQVLKLLDRMGRGGVGAIRSVVALIETARLTDPLLGRAMQAAGTLVPYADEKAREEAERVLITKAFDSPGLSEARAAYQLSFSYADVARFLHRKEVDVHGSPDKWRQLLAEGGPFHRELAAQLLATRSDAATAEALRVALLTKHPTQVEFKFSSSRVLGTAHTIQEHDDAIHGAAARSLARLQGGHARAMGHVWLLAHGSLEERRAAARSLYLEPVVSRDLFRVLEVLGRSLATEDPIVLREVVTALGSFEHPDQDWLRAKMAALAEHRDKGVAARAKAVLRRLQRK